MLIELDRKDLISLVKGTSPYYSIFENPLVKQCGSYCGGMCDEWSWTSVYLEELSDKELFELYALCKDSWK